MGWAAAKGGSAEAATCRGGLGAPSLLGAPWTWAPGRESRESALACLHGPGHKAAAWEAASAQTLARPPPRALPHSPTPRGPRREPREEQTRTKAQLSAGRRQARAEVRRWLSASGRSRTRRRSALSGAHPALLREESRLGLETPCPSPSGALSFFPPRTSPLGRMVAGTREDRSAKNENVDCSVVSFSCNVFKQRCCP